MIYFLATIAAIAGFLFGYDEGVIAVVRPSLDKDFPMGPLVGGFMTAAVPLGALAAASVAGRIIDRFGRRRIEKRSSWNRQWAVGKIALCHECRQRQCAPVQDQRQHRQTHGD